MYPESYSFSKSGRACRRQQQLSGGVIRAACGGGAAGDRGAGVAAGAAVQAQRGARRHPRPVRRVRAQGPRLRDGRPGQSVRCSDHTFWP